MRKDIDYEEFPQTIHNLKLLCYRDYYTYIPEEFSQEIQNDILSSFVRDFLGLLSLDYTKKRYVEPNEKPFGYNETNSYYHLLHKITSSIWTIFSKNYETIDNLKLNEETIISLGLVTAFGRLKNSYESSLFLIKNRFFFESTAINRLIFEQINYCFNLCHLTNNDFENLSEHQLRNRLSPTNINKLKQFLPDSEIGTFYSYLSELTHIDYKQIHNFISYDKKINQNVITMKSIIQSINSALLLLKILDLHCIVFEYSFANISDCNCKNIYKTKSGIKLKRDRLARKLFIKYSKEFEKILRKVELEIKYTIKNHEYKNEDLPY